MGRTEIAEKTGDRVSIKCAFCGGTGKDPFGLLSVLSTCQVCGGRGKVAVREPFARCAFCTGTGVHPFHRLTCTVCGGKGVVPVPTHGERKVCPKCRGSGKSHPNWNVACLKCKGKGFVAA